MKRKLKERARNIFRAFYFSKCCLFILFFALAILVTAIIFAEHIVITLQRHGNIPELKQRIAVADQCSLLPQKYYNEKLPFADNTDLLNCFMQFKRSGRKGC